MFTSIFPGLCLEVWSLLRHQPGRLQRQSLRWLPQWQLGRTWVPLWCLGVQGTRGIVEKQLSYHVSFPCQGAAHKCPEKKTRRHSQQQQRFLFTNLFVPHLNAAPTHSSTFPEPSRTLTFLERSSGTKSEICTRSLQNLPRIFQKLREHDFRPRLTRCNLAKTCWNLF